jgi:hypothetical protein
LAADVGGVGDEDGREEKATTESQKHREKRGERTRVKRRDDGKKITQRRRVR